MNPGDERRLRDEHEQRAFGREVARALPAGAVLFLEGELGSGKTTFTQGLVGALGFDGEVNSPTYALMQVYPTPQGPVLHVDAYRVQHAAELYSMDLEQQVEDSRLSVIEWGQLFYQDFPSAWRLEFRYADGGGRVVRRVR